MTQVLVYEAVKLQLEIWSEASYPYETGGILLGILGDGQPWIIAAVQVRSDTPGRSSYELPAGATQAMVRRMRERDPRVGYLGDWHSHPMDLPASSTDRATFRRVFMRALRLRDEAPLMIVLRRSASGWQTDLLAHTGLVQRARPVQFVLTGPPPEPAGVEAA